MTILDDIHQIVNNAKPSAETVIWSQPLSDNNLRPPQPYIAIQFLNMAQIGQQEIKSSDSDALKFRDVYEMTLGIQYISSGYDSMFMSEELRANLEIDREYELSLDSDISYRRSAPIVNISELIRTEFENRASFDVVFEVSIEKEKTSEFIELINDIRGTVSNCVDEKQFEFDVDLT